MLCGAVRCGAVLPATGTQSWWCKWPLLPEPGLRPPIARPGLCRHADPGRTGDPGWRLGKTGRQELGAGSWTLSEVAARKGRMGRGHGTEGGRPSERVCVSCWQRGTRAIPARLALRCWLWRALRSIIWPPEGTGLAATAPRREGGSTAAASGSWMGSRLAARRTGRRTR